MVTNLEIVDTAVKIGLGALISGVVAYLIARLNHAKEIDKEYIKRRRDMVQSIAAEFQSCHQRQMELFIRINRAIEARKSGRSVTQIEADAIAGLLQEIIPITREVTNTAARLRLLGEVEAAELVGQYMNFVSGIGERFNQGAPSPNIEADCNNMELMKNSLFTKLSEALRRS